MKKFLIAASVIFASSSAVMATEFCDGFHAGYSAGYKRAAESSLEPLKQLCPLKPLRSFGDPESDFELGYLIGIEQGMMEGR